MSASDELIQQYQDRTEYDHGFVTDIETIDVPKGLSEETIKFISNNIANNQEKKNISSYLSSLYQPKLDQIGLYSNSAIFISIATIDSTTKLSMSVAPFLWCNVFKVSIREDSKL